MKTIMIIGAGEAQMPLIEAASKERYHTVVCDINPQAPVHVLVLPKKHMANILECDGETMKALLNAVQIIAKQEGVAEDGFRIVSNCGKNGAQSVGHLHIHLMGGAQLSGTMA